MTSKLSHEEAEALQSGRCPDCHSPAIVPGPKGGLAQNKACSHCGAEFNDMRFMVDRNTPKGQPNRGRLLRVFGIMELGL